LGGLFLVGEQNLRHNLPGRPMLDPVQAMWFVLGLIITIAQVARGLRRHISHFTLYASLLIWFPVMLLPTYLTSDAPHFGRAIGIMPVVAVLMAWGMDGVWTWARRRKGATWATALALAAGLIYTGVHTVQDYFVNWAGHPELGAAFQVDFAALGEYARSLPADESVYMTPPTEEFATILFTLDGQDRKGIVQTIKSFTSAAGAVPAGRENHAATYLIRPGDKTALRLLERRLAQGKVVETGPYFTVYRAPAAGPRVKPSALLAANWTNEIALLGYDLPDGPFHAGQDVVVTIYWRALGKVDLPYTFFVHLLGPFNPATNGPLWGQHDAQPGDGTYPTDAWDPGEIVVDEYVVPIPPATPPGEYELEAGFYYLPTLERLPVMDDAGQPIGDRVLLESILVAE
jgi:hypothetical protein